MGKAFIRSILSARWGEFPVFYQVDDCSFVDANDDGVEDLTLISKLRIQNASSPSADAPLLRSDDEFSHWRESLPVFLTSLSLTFGGQDGLSQEQLGRLGAISFIGLVLGILIAGPASDRWGAKGFAIGGNGIMVFSLVGMSLAPDYGTLGLAVFWLGFGAGILDMILSPVVAVLNPDRRSAAMNWLHSFYCVGAVVTILASTVALQIGFSWRHACFLLLPLPLVLLGAFALLRFPALVADETGGRTPLRHLLRGRWFWGALAAIFLGGAPNWEWLSGYRPMPKPPWGIRSGLVGWLYCCSRWPWQPGGWPSGQSAKGLILS